MSVPGFNVKSGHSDVGIGGGGGGGGGCLAISGLNVLFCDEEGPPEGCTTGGGGGITSVMRLDLGGLGASAGLAANVGRSSSGSVYASSSRPSMFSAFNVV